MSSNKYGWIQYFYFDIFGNQITDDGIQKGEFESQLNALSESIEDVKSHLIIKITNIDTQLDDHMNGKEVDLKVNKQIQTK